MKQLWIELGKKCLLSVAIYAALFIVLYLVERFVPALQGRLLRWDSAAFIVGIPASVIGTAYVLTIKNPNNYLGFYLGIIMSLLLAVQFYLQAQYEFVVLYALVFTTFMIRSIITWRKAAQATDAEPLAPSFVSRKYLIINICFFLIVALLDYIFATYVNDGGAWGCNVWIKIAGAASLSSSIFANFWLMYKANDAWIFWVIYSVSGMVLFALLGNIFSFVLFTMFLIINGTAQVSWLKMTTPENNGWTASVKPRKK